MEHRLIIILDPAHGSDVMGKASPDGSHREYVWSRHICKLLSEALKSQGYEVYFTNTQDIEIGLTRRQKIANEIKCPVGYKKLLISPHNNAAGSEGKWLKATGYEVWTSKGTTSSDKYAQIFLENLKEDFPKYKSRGLKESNFTVLMGNTYSAILLEWMFQDNLEDVGVLKDDKVNGSLVNSLVKSINQIDKTLQP